MMLFKCKFQLSVTDTPNIMEVIKIVETELGQECGMTGEEEKFLHGFLVGKTAR